MSTQVPEFMYSNLLKLIDNMDLKNLHDLNANADLEEVKGLQPSGENKKVFLATEDLPASSKRQKMDEFGQTDVAPVTDQPQSEASRPEPKDKFTPDLPPPSSSDSPEAEKKDEYDKENEPLLRRCTVCKTAYFKNLEDLAYHRSKFHPIPLSIAKKRKKKQQQRKESVKSKKVASEVARPRGTKRKQSDLFDDDSDEYDEDDVRLRKGPKKVIDDDDIDMIKDIKQKGKGYGKSTKVQSKKRVFDKWL